MTLLWKIVDEFNMSTGVYTMQLQLLTSILQTIMERLS
jgi:hypothetical protein